MTWLLRLIPNGRSSLQRATKRRRRMMSLEALEHRIVLSNVTVSFLTPTSPLTIMGDTFNDNFTITENPDDTVTVVRGYLRRPGWGWCPQHDRRARTVYHRPRGHVDHCRSPGHHQLRLRHPVRRGQDHSDDRQERHRHGDRGHLTFAANNVDNSGNFVLSDTFASPNGRRAQGHRGQQLVRDALDHPDAAAGLAASSWGMITSPPA